MLWYILLFVIVLIFSSVLTSYIGDIKATNNIEGFVGNESSIDATNSHIAESVTTLEDRLRLDKYKSEYKKTVSLSKDYLDALKVSVLYDLKEINPKTDDEVVIVDKCQKLAKKLNALNDGINALSNMSVDNSGKSNFGIF